MENKKKTMKERWEESKKFAYDHAEGFIVAGGIIGFVGFVIIENAKITGSNKQLDIEGLDILNTLESSMNKPDFGRDLEMRFVDPETEEVLGVELCTESYMKDFMDYE